MVRRVELDMVEGEQIVTILLGEDTMQLICAKGVKRRMVNVRKMEDGDEKMAKTHLMTI